MVRALYIGRFNPPHLGHLEAVRFILSQPDISELVIGIGSAQESYTLSNPLTAGERCELVIAMIREIALQKPNYFLVIPIQDMNNNSLWVAHVLSICPSFDVVFSNNSLVRTLFENSGKKVESIPLVNRESYSGTTIRKRIENNLPWKQDVPPTVSRLLGELKIQERLSKLAQSDT